MKKTILLCLCFIGFFKVIAFNDYSKKQFGDTLPKVYLGIGTGVNSFTGMLGIGMDIKCVDRLFLRIGAGIGSWGYKVSGGIKHERKNKKGWIFSAFYTFNSGLKNFKYPLETISGKDLIIKEVTIDLKQATTISLSTGYNWYFKKKNKFYLEFGYSVPFEAEPYNVTDGSKLTDKSKNTLKLTQPGGIVFGLGVMFGL